MVQLSSTTQLNWGTYNTVLSLTLTNIGLYDLYATMTYEWFTGSAATNQINYSISTSTSAPDSNSYASGYATPYFAVATNGLETVNFRRIYYNTTNPTTMYFIVYFSGGAYNYGYATTPTIFQSIRIA